MTYLLAIDEGTSSARCVIFDQNAQPIAVTQKEFRQYYPEPGWVEQDAQEIWQSQLQVIQQALLQTRCQPRDIAGIGITNQRETTVIWNRKTGLPIHRVIVWQDRRTADYCLQLKNAGYEDLIRQKTGLLLDAYFSASKIRWLLDHIEGARESAERGELAFGTIDTWLVWNLSNGALHITDVSNASRTLLFNIEQMAWDEELLQLFAIPASLLPSVKTSSEIYGLTQNPGIGTGIPIAAIAGDQQAALFGQLCFKPGSAKCTYGTGSFLMINAGKKIPPASPAFLSTIAWQIGEEVTYAREGSIFMGGAIIQWLRDGLQILEKASDSEALAASVSDNGGVYFVPALTGLGAPHWDPNARGTIFGITRGTTRAHLTRAALESIAFQVDELLALINSNTEIHSISELKIDGGASMNNMLAQFQADLSRMTVSRPQNLETTALGAAFLAGLSVGYWKLSDLDGLSRADCTFHPTLPIEKVEALKANWKKSVARSLGWLS
jgi:glycerol kinase